MAMRRLITPVRTVLTAAPSPTNDTYVPYVRTLRSSYRWLRQHIIQFIVIFTGNLNPAHSLSITVRVRIPFINVPRYTRTHTISLSLSLSRCLPSPLFKIFQLFFFSPSVPLLLLAHHFLDGSNGIKSRVIARPAALPAMTWSATT